MFAKPFRESFLSSHQHFANALIILIKFEVLIKYLIDMKETNNQTYRH